MARQPEFDRAEVVQKAMQVFWRQGFQGASMKELGLAMQLQPGSIYAAFGSKEALFREALASYVHGVRALAKKALGPRSLIEGWFAAHINAALDVARGEPGRGCLLLNSTLETNALDEETANALRTQLKALERVFFTAIVELRGACAGADTPKPTPRATARLLVAALAGISALSRSGADRRTLQEIASAALMSL